MGWTAFQYAPRDRDVWLFLPAASYKQQPNGTVTDVTHAVVRGKWDQKQSAWVDRTSGHVVYPSLCHDADVNGDPPAHPDLDVA
jgi:hypothetical protein